MHSLKAIEHSVLLARTRSPQVITEELYTDLVHVLDVADYVQSLLQDGMDCPFCGFQQHHENGHEVHCPMRFFPEAKYQGQD